jgi:hypothetical protein
MANIITEVKINKSNLQIYYNIYTNLKKIYIYIYNENCKT